MLKYFLKFIILISLSNICFKSILADDATNQVLRYLSCETGAIADISAYGSPQTCVMEPLMDQAVTALLTFGQSENMAFRLKMNHEQLYPGNCSRANRAAYWNPTIDFGFCNNGLLLITGILNTIGDVLQGQAPSLDPCEYILDYGGTAPTSGAGSIFEAGSGPQLPGGGSLPTWYQVNRVATPNTSTCAKDTSAANFLTNNISSYGPTCVLGLCLMADVGFTVSGLAPVAFSYNITISQDKICINILTLTGAYVPVGCKYIAEPFPVSIYATQDAVATSGDSIASCNSVYNCSEQAKASSQALAPILSPIIGCVREMILRLVISTEVCNPTALTNAESNDMAIAFAKGINNGSIINQFQRNMQTMVGSLLTVYVILFGFKVAMGGAQIKPADMINFILKFLFVTYFAIGINMTSQGQVMRFDGMTQWVFPFLLNGVTEIASWMMGASSVNGLCDFSTAEYPTNSDINMALWDQIDCRLAYYIGYDGLVEKLMGDASHDPVQHQIPPYVFLLVPALITGSEQLISMALMYPIMIISFVAYALCMFVSGLILILILGALAPIFVTCALFDVTKEYFSKWWKSLFGLMIQPAIALTFMGLMFAVYDRSFYGTCIYNSVTIAYTAEEGGPTKNYRSYFITLDPSQYDSQLEIDGCTSSLGYFLNNPLQSVFGTVTNPTISGSVNQTIQVNAYDPNNLASQPDNAQAYMNGTQRPQLQMANGLFTQSPKMFWEELVGIIKNFIVCFIMLTVLQNLMDSIVGFITSLSGSEISAGGNFDPGKIQGKLNQAAGAAAGKAAKGVSKLKQSMAKRKGAGGEGGKESSKEEKDSKDKSHNNEHNQNRGKGEGHEEGHEGDGKGEGSSGESKKKKDDKGGGDGDGGSSGSIGDVMDFMWRQ